MRAIAFLLSLLAFFSLPAALSFGQDEHYFVPADCAEYHDGYAILTDMAADLDSQHAFHLRMAYIELSKKAYVHEGKLSSPGPDYSFAEWALKLYALNTELDHNHNILKTLESYNLNAVLFIPMYKEALAWSETEKNQSGWHLYNQYKKASKAGTYPDYFQNGFKNTYYNLAREKNSVRAQFDEWLDYLRALYQFVLFIIDPTTLLESNQDTK